MNDRNLVKKCNKLSRRLGAADGWEVPDGFLFYTSKNPRAQHYWLLAAVAIEFLRKCDMQSALASLERV